MMRSRTTIKAISLSKWFPANDAFAAGMARLCILREDFLFELHLYLESVEVPLKEDFGPDWRRLYFFRRMCNTVHEVKRAVEAISKEGDFKKLLCKLPEPLAKDWGTFKKALNEADMMVKAIRDKISAHIEPGPIMETLAWICDDDGCGMLQIDSELPRRTHYKFTEELLNAIWLRDIPVARVKEEVQDRIAKFLAAVENILVMIHAIFYFYAEERGLKGEL